VSSKSSQRDIFREQEGNGYFLRNASSLEQPSVIGNLVAERIAHHLSPAVKSRVLEIGCASGTNLAALNELRPIDGYGIDPSTDAVHAGKQRFPQLALQLGTADSLPFDDGSMDVTWFGFCLYLVDRPLLHRVVAEADRVLKDGGILAILDFDPDLPRVRPYRHQAGINSYKMDYSRLFLCDPAYLLAEKVSFGHDNLQWMSDAQERLALWICRKNLQMAYLSEKK
jgi:SAM-dependent methyltransferase